MILIVSTFTSVKGTEGKKKKPEASVCRSAATQKFCLHEESKLSTRA